MKKPKIGIDLLGSDVCLESFLHSVTPILNKLSMNAEFIVFLKEEHRSLIPPLPFQLVFVSDIILMDDNPLHALRKKRNSSISQGMRLLKEGQIDAFISSGNTGALVAAGKTMLKTIQGIQRPALLTVIPAHGKQVAVLDVGANTTCKPSFLLQCAHMGIAYQKSRKISHPTVGLLNIGSEKMKGTPEHRQAYQALQKLNLTTTSKVFLGNIEGREVFTGPVDVLVTDGFTGNVFLKTSEGMAALLLEELSQFLSQSENLKALPFSFLQEWMKKLDYSEYPGAILCGVKGIVLKCHGSFHPKSLQPSILMAIELYEQKFLEAMASECNP